MDAAEVYRKAADLIEEKGWIRGSRGWFGTAGFCLEGACASAAAGRNLFVEDIYPHESRPSWYVTLQGILGWEGSKLFVWNDAAGRTGEEVITALRGAADVLDAQNGVGLDEPALAVAA